MLSSSSRSSHRWWRSAWRFPANRFSAALDFEHAPVGLAHVALDGRILRVNRKLCDFLGYTRDELKRQRVHDITYRDDLRPDLVLAGRAIAGEITTYRIEKRYIRGNGEIAWADITVSLLRDARDRPQYFMSIVSDITARKRAEEALRKSEQQLALTLEKLQQCNDTLKACYAAVFEHTTAALVLLSITPDDRFVYEAVSSAYERTSGRKAAEFLGKTHYDLFPHDLADRLVEHFRLCRDMGAPIPYEDAFPYPAGTHMIQATVIPIRGAGGRITKILVSKHDLTERMATEEARRQSQKMEALELLTGEVAHDFSNLLTVIQSNLQLMARRADNSTFRQLLDGATGAAERGAKLTRQLLDFTRRQRLERQPIDLNRLVAGMTDLLLSTIGATIRIETLPGKELWPAMVDANQLELVILNLAINARDAMPNGGVLSIKVENVHISRGGQPRNLAAGDYVMLSLADNGTGMSEEVKARAFEPFFTTKPVGRGSGLGLSQVYGIALQLGGSVEIDSRLGMGTTVRVYLPRAEQPSPREPE
jgi:PAS domain S-box-containing protein